jgi:hypothetical protein
MNKMKNKTINDEEIINEINTLSVKGSAMSFDDSTSPDSFIGMREGEDM